MNSIENIKKEINLLKEKNKRSGNILQSQLHSVMEYEWTREDLSILLKTDIDAVDLLDEDLESFDELQENIRNIQDGIINYFGE